MPVIPRDRLRNALLTLLAALLVAPWFGNITAANAATPASLSDLGQVGAYVLVDVDTGYVLASSNERTLLPPASLTKVLTGLVVTKRLAKDAKIPVTQTAASMPARKMGMTPGTLWNRDDALYSMMLASANDVSYALAEATGNGDIKGFATQLDVLKSRLNMADAPILQDPSGLDDQFSVNGGNRISARDLAIAGRAALADPQLAPIMATTTYNFADPAGTQRSITNHNKMLTSYPGTTGLKTGFTKAAGRSVMVSATREGRSMLVVLLDTPGMWDVAPRLLDYGFSLPIQQQPIVDRLPSVPGRPNVDIPGVANLPEAAAIAEATTVVPSQPTDATPTDATPTTVAAVAIGEAVTLDRNDAPVPVPADRGGLGLLVRGLAAVVVLLLFAVAVLRTRVILRKKRRSRNRLVPPALHLDDIDLTDVQTDFDDYEFSYNAISQYDVVATPTAVKPVHGIKKPTRS
jgi:D-alanyl-D-alanine carboxypeptidase (penicillin-binding protein 5/6)